MRNWNATVNHLNGWFQNRLGGSFVRNPPWGELGQIRKGQKHINVLELIEVKLAILTFIRGTLVTVIYLQKDNMATVLRGENAGNLQSRTPTIGQGNVGVSGSQLISTYSRGLTKHSEYSGRLAIQKSQRFKRLEIEPQNIFSDCENQRNTSNRPICFPTEPSVIKYAYSAIWI